MAVKTLTNKIIKDSTCPNGKLKIDIHDLACKGLMIEIRASGGKTFYLRYKDERQKVRQLRLGDAQDLPLEKARKKADSLRAKIAMGEDPASEKLIKRSTPLLRDFILNSYMPYAKVNKRSWETDWSLLKNHIIPNFGDLYMDSFTKQHLFGFVAKHRETHAPASVNRVIILLRFLFNSAIRWDTPGIKTNPTAGVPLLEENNKKERYLSETEAQALFESVKMSESKMLQFIIPMLILTGTRKREVLDAKWSEFDFDRRIWRIGMSKSGKARHVPMSDGVIMLLQTVPRQANNGYVFPNPKTGKPFVSIFSSWDTARKRAGLAEVRIHDLRHSFASFLVNGGRSLYEVQKILGHTQIKTTQRYAHLANDTLLDAANQVSKLVPLASMMPKSIESVPLVNVLAA